MSARATFGVVGVAALLLAGAAIEGVARPQPRVPAAHPGRDVTGGEPRGRTELLRAPLSFVANTGALDDRVAFWLPGAEATVYLTDVGLTYQLGKASPAEATSADLPPAEVVPAGWVVAQDFVGAAPVRPVATESSPTTANFFTGTRDRWRTSVPTAAAVSYPGLWPGVDATYRGDGERLKYEFTLAPGTDPATVRLAYRGATAVTLTPTGDLRVDSPAGGFTDAAPTAYQVVGGERTSVTVSYALDGPEPDGTQPDPKVPLERPHVAVGRRSGPTWDRSRWLTPP